MGNSVYSTKNFTIANIMASKHLTKDAKIYLGIDNISNHRNFGAYADGNLGRLYRVGMDINFIHSKKYLAGLMPARYF